MPINCTYIGLYLSLLAYQWTLIRLVYIVCLNIHACQEKSQQLPTTHLVRIGGLAEHHPLGYQPQ